MKHIGSLVRLEYGEELHAQLAEHARQTGDKGAWLQGIGGANKVTLGFYDLPTKQYQWKTFGEPMEIVSLSGNLSWVDGKPFWHIHGVFSARNYHTVGGHIKELYVGPTCELKVAPLGTALSRSYDEETGLPLLSQVE